MAKIYRIRVRQVVERVFRVKADGRQEAEDKAVSHASKPLSYQLPHSPAVLPIGASGSCEAVGTAEDKDQTTPPDID